MQYAVCGRVAWWRGGRLAALQFSPPAPWAGYRRVFREGRGPLARMSWEIAPRSPQSGSAVAQYWRIRDACDREPPLETLHQTKDCAAKIVSSNRDRTKIRETRRCGRCGQWACCLRSCCWWCWCRPAPPPRAVTRQTCARTSPRAALRVLLVSPYSLLLTPLSTITRNASDSSKYN